MRFLTPILRPRRRRPAPGRRDGWLSFVALTALLLPVAFAAVVHDPAADVTAATRNVATTYHDGVFSQAAPRFCTATDVFTPSSRVRTKIVRHSDGWTSTVSSRYRKWVHCTARQMTPTMWCTTRLVDGFSGICITPEPKAAGISPCANPRLDVRSVYYPRTGRLAITCVNEASTSTSPAAGPVTRTDARGDASPAALDILRTRVVNSDRISVRTHFLTVRRGTGYVTFLDPGRRGGAMVRMWVQVRADRSASGHLDHRAAASPDGGFAAAPCRGMRTSVDFAADVLRASVPSRCVRRYASLGRGVWVSLNSFALPIGPAGGDLLPDDQSKAFRVPRS